MCHRSCPEQECFHLFVLFVLMCCETHNAIKAVEGGVEVGLFAQAVHLYKHLRQEYPQEDEFSKIYTEGRSQGEKLSVKEDHQSLHLSFSICK